MTNQHQNIPKFNNILQYMNNMFYIIRLIVTFLIGLLDRVSSSVFLFLVSKTV